MRVSLMYMWVCVCACVYASMYVCGSELVWKCNKLLLQGCTMSTFVIYFIFLFTYSEPYFTFDLTSVLYLCIVNLYSLLTWEVQWVMYAGLHIPLQYLQLLQLMARYSFRITLKITSKFNWTMFLIIFILFLLKYMFA